MYRWKSLVCGGFPMTLPRLPSLLLLLCLLLTICIAPAAASSPYADLLQDPSRSTEDKLADFADAIGWRDELGTYQMEMENYEMQVAQQQAEIQQAQELQEAAAALGLDISSTVESALESIATTAPPYTAEELAALDAESAAYYDAFAANYVATAAFTGSGSGTQSDPYIITNRAQLEAMADDLTAYYQLANDIDLGGSSSPWTPIGTASAPFSGTLDGNGYVISNLYIRNLMYAGLFDYISGATISKLGVINVDIVLNSGTGDKNAAAIAARAHGGSITISKCFAGIDQISITSGSTGNSRQYVGGLITASANTATKITITDCFVYGSNLESTASSYSPVASGVAALTFSATADVERVYSDVSTISVADGAWYSTASGVIPGFNSGASTANVVALGSSISGSATEQDGIGRVIARSMSGYTLSMVYANAAMLINGNTVSGGTSTNKNGADVSASTYNTQAFWQNTLGWNFDTVWYWDDTANLPKLRAFLHGPTISSVSATPTTGGTTTQITLSATVQDATSYQWQYSLNSGGTWQDITGATSATATWTPGAVGTYQVQLLATNSDGTTTSDPVTVTIYDVPTVSATASPTQGPLTQQITLSGSATDPASSVSPTTYQWQQAVVRLGRHHVLPARGDRRWGHGIQQCGILHCV